MVSKASAWRLTDQDVVMTKPSPYFQSIGWQRADVDIHARQSLDHSFRASAGNKRIWIYMLGKALARQTKRAASYSNGCSNTQTVAASNRWLRYKQHVHTRKAARRHGRAQLLSDPSRNLRDKELNLCADCSQGPKQRGAMEGPSFCGTLQETSGIRI